MKNISDFFKAALLALLIIFVIGSVSALFIPEEDLEEADPTDTEISDSETDPPEQESDSEPASGIVVGDYSKDRDVIDFNYFWGE